LNGVVQCLRDVILTDHIRKNLRPPFSC
jgi:hypothetical protein